MIHTSDSTCCAVSVLVAMAVGEDVVGYQTASLKNRLRRKGIAAKDPDCPPRIRL